MMFSKFTLLRRTARSIPRVLPRLYATMSKQRVPFLLADIGEGITECQVVQLFVKEGDHVQQFDKICEVHSDKASVEITSRYDGKIAKIHHKEGDTAFVGQPLVDIDVESEEIEPEIGITQDASVLPMSNSNLSTEEAMEPPPLSTSHVLATPAVRRIARENKLDLSVIQGSGKDGRVMKGDLLALVNGNANAIPASIPIVKSESSIAESCSKHSSTFVPLTSVQKAMFKSMTASLAIPHFVYSDSIRMDKLIALRSLYNQKHDEKQKISLMPFFMRAMALAIDRFPIVNAKLHTRDGKLEWERRESVNISVAVDTKDGLIVPNIKNVRNLSMDELKTQLNQFKMKAKSGSWNSNELTGGTITLSNIGAIGGTSFHPILFDNQVCIGAVGKIKKEVIVDNDIITSAHMMNVSFSGDHRLLDGATLARFVDLWKTYLETPELMLFESK